VTRAHAVLPLRAHDRTCSADEGLLLHVLAAGRGIARAGATRAGVGAAWIAAALEPSVPFVVAEPDAGRAAAARRLFAGDPNTRISTGGWAESLWPEAPFDLLYADSEDVRGEVDTLVGLLTPGGTVVVTGPPGAVLRHPELVSAQLPLAGERCAFLGVRRR